MRADAAKSVFELTRMIKELVEQSADLSGVAVRGEVSNVSRPASGHIYFTLKDDLARLRVVMFAGRARFLRFALRDGMSVIVQGNVSVFERMGDYQLYADFVEPDGLGALYLAFLQLKEKLDAQGLFDAGRKRALPPFPARVALVTSATGAAVRDMVTTLARRYPAALVRIVPVAVQGEEAPRQIARAIRLVCERRLADVMIVGRGGGSLEELFAFNTETVAMAIADADIPVVSAVGHETDTTIADFVADVRAATPTAAAELVAPDWREIDARLAGLAGRASQAVSAGLSRARLRLERLAQSRALGQQDRRVAVLHQRIDQAERSLRESLGARVRSGGQTVSSLELRLARRSPAVRVEGLALGLGTLEGRLRRAATQLIRERDAVLAHAASRLDLLNPMAVMGRGFAIAYRVPGQGIVRSVDDVQPGDAVRVQLTDGWLDCQVWGVHGSDGTDGAKR